jgi:serine protease Do
LIAGKVISPFNRGNALAGKLDLGAKYELSGGVLKVAEVKPGSLAEKAGLKVKDLVAKIDGKNVSSLDEIKKIMESKKNGDEVVVEVDRGIERLTLKVVLKS